MTIITRSDKIIRRNSPYIEVEPPGPDEQVGSWAGLDLIAYPIYRIDMSVQDYSQWMTVGATHTYEPTSAWDGGPCARVTPCTGDGGYSSVCHKSDLHQSGALEIRQLNIRYEFFAGDTWASNHDTSDCKFTIVHAGPTNEPSADHRPIMNFQTPNGSVVNMAVAAGTLKQFNPNPPPDDYFNDGGNEEFYFGDTDGTYSGSPVVGAGTWVTIEMFMSAVAIPGYDNGRIAIRVTKRDGTVLTTLSIPWTYGGWSLGDYINEVQVLTGYYNAPGNPSNVDNYFRIAGVTYAANQTDFLGPRAGF